MDRNKKLAIVIVAVLAITLGTSTMFITILPVEDYGTIKMWKQNPDSTLDVSFTEGQSLNVQDGDSLRVSLANDPMTDYVPDEYDISADLRTDADDVVRVSGSRTHYPSLHRYDWHFDLASCPTGTFIYHIYFSAPISSTMRIGQESFTFTITNDEAPSYEDAEIITGPEPEVSFGVDQLVAITWKFNYNGSCVAFVTVDDVKGSEQIFGVSTGERTFNHFVDTTVVGTQEIFFTVDPDAVDNLPVESDPVTVIIGEPATTTTTPTTTPTGTDTGTAPPTTTDREPPPDMDYTLLGIGAVGAVLILLLLVRRRR